jgi:hypothetical protein
MRRTMGWTVAMALGIAGGGALGIAIQTASAQMPGTGMQQAAPVQMPGMPGMPGMGGMQAAPPSPSPCNGFLPLRDDAQKKGAAIAAAEKRHADRQELCKVVTTFSAAEEKAAQFLEKNKGFCGVPDQAISSAKEMHAKTVKFREMVCAPAPQPHVPTLSDAMGAPALDTAKNTKTGAGTFDTLTGNPLAK